MGIRVSVTLGMIRTVSDGVNLRGSHRNTYGNTAIGNFGGDTQGI